MSTKTPNVEALQTEWKRMFQQLLPQAATSKSPAQPKWPVHVDHCFARIILDSTVGQQTRPWMKIIKSPAYKNMSANQLKASIDLGRQILDGTTNLVELDSKSLECRGKGKGKSGNASGKVKVEMGEKRKRDVDENDEGTSKREREKLRKPSRIAQVT